MNNNTKDEKKALRAYYRTAREALTPEERAPMDARICEVIASCASYRYAETVLGYVPFGFEVNIMPLLARVLADGKRLALPRTYGRGEMTFRYVTTLDSLQLGSYGIPEPSEECPPYEGSPATLCLVPAIVYDRHGRRIGYGGGYYDRFLRSFAVTALGVIYRSFVIPALPLGRYDHALPAIATERGILPIQP